MEPEQFRSQITKLFELLRLNEPSVDVDFENRKVAVFINEGPWFEKWVPRLVGEFEHVIRLMGKRYELERLYLDLNNYRKERERLIVELAKAAARKVLLAREEIRLPAMNAYERRLVHVELSVHPDVKTESVGEGEARCVIVKPLYGVSSPPTGAAGGSSAGAGSVNS